jgi:hypothetical protein
MPFGRINDYQETLQEGQRKVTPYPLLTIPRFWSREHHSRSIYDPVELSLRLLNDAVSTTEESGRRVTLMNDEYVGTREEKVTTCFKVLTRHLSEQAVEKKENPQPGRDSN